MDSTPEQVDEVWEEWLVWRATGERDMNGGFRPAVSFLEAMRSIPRWKLDVFFELDTVYGKMERQYIKQTGKGNS